jgi:hypothetical protein
VADENAEALAAAVAALDGGATGEDAARAWAELSRVLLVTGQAGPALILALHAEHISGADARVRGQRDMCLLELGLARSAGSGGDRDTSSTVVVRHDKLIVWLESELGPYGRDLGRAAQAVLSTARDRIAVTPAPAPAATT